MNLRKQLNSINARTSLSIIVFSITILLLLWFSQIGFLSIFYEKYQINSTERIAKEIQNTSDISLVNDLENLAYINNVCMEYIYSNGFAISYNTKISGCILRNPEIKITQYKNNLINQDLSLNALKLIDPNHKTKTLLYAVKVNDGFIFINTPLEDINSTTTVLRSQLIYITLLAIVLSCLIAYFISKSITKPIINITRKAKMIGKGETVNFDKSGITEIDDLADTLNYAQEELAITEELRRDLMANVSHDLKTPLTMIKAYAEMIKDFSHQSRKKRESHLDIIIEETNRLNILVNDILVLSKMQADADKLNIETFNLTDEINEIIKRYEIIKETEDYKINIELLCDMIVTADKHKINQVIYNLINNAINYTGKDRTITIKATAEDMYYLIEIIDTGKGIKPEEVDYIWDKYYKEEKNHQRNIVGTGLGLSIVKTILSKHNFPYGVKSNHKKGTTFYFKIKKNNL